VIPSLSTCQPSRAATTPARCLSLSLSLFLSRNAALLDNKLYSTSTRTVLRTTGSPSRRRHRWHIGNENRDPDARDNFASQPRALDDSDTIARYFFPVTPPQTSVSVVKSSGSPLFFPREGSSWISVRCILRLVSQRALRHASSIAIAIMRGSIRETLKFHPSVISLLHSSGLTVRYIESLFVFKIYNN